MKNIIFLFIVLLSFESHAQFKNYKIEGNKVKVVKMYSDISTLQIQQQANSNTITNLESKDLTTFLVGKIAKIPDYVSQYLKKRKKKYSATYEAKNTLTKASDEFPLELLTFERNVFLKDQTSYINAMKLTLKPVLIQENSFLSFKVDTLIFNYSKAIVKPKAPFLNLLIEIKVFYAKAKDDNTLVKTEMKSSNIIVPVDLRKTSQDLTLVQNQFSDVFLPNGITEISVKVTEINPYKLKLEELESFINDNNEDLSGLFEELSKVLKE